MPASRTVRPIFPDKHQTIPNLTPVPSLTHSLNSNADVIAWASQRHPAARRSCIINTDLRTNHSAFFPKAHHSLMCCNSSWQMYIQWLHRAEGEGAVVGIDFMCVVRYDELGTDNNRSRPHLHQIHPFLIFHPSSSFSVFGVPGLTQANPFPASLQRTTPQVQMQSTQSR